MTQAAILRKESELKSDKRWDKEWGPKMAKIQTSKKSNRRAQNIGKAVLVGKYPVMFGVWFDIFSS